MPGSVSIVTDAIGLTVLLVAPMPILTKLAIAGSFWVLTNLVTVVILDPILCCYFPAPRHLPKGGEGHWLETPLRRLGGFCVSPIGASARHGLFRRDRRVEPLLVSVFDRRRFSSGLAAIVARFELQPERAPHQRKISGYGPSLRYR